MSGGPPDDRRKPDTLRPPARGNEEQVGLPGGEAARARRRSSHPPSAAPTGARRSSAPPDPAGAARASSIPPPALRSSARGPHRPRALDPRTEDGHPVHREVARSSLDAMSSSLPEPDAMGRQQRIEQAVRDLLRAGPDTDAPLRKRLVSFGPDALPALTRAFPGTIWVDLGRPHRPLRDARQLSAVAGAMVAFGDAAVPHVARLLRSSRPEARFGACLVAVDLVHGDLVRPLAARLRDEYPLVRDAAMMALRASALLPELRVLRAELVATLQDEEMPAQWRHEAAWTLGRLRDAEVVPQLIEELAAPAQVARAARAALVRIVGRDLGPFRFRWRRWWRKHRDEGRARWLVDALAQSDDALRVRAFDELVLLTGVGFDRRHAAKSREGGKELRAFFEARLTEGVAAD